MTDKNSFWQDRPVLVTGTTGLLGGWLCRKLVQRGASVIALVRDEVPQSKWLTDGTAKKTIRVNGDITSLDLIKRTINEYAVDTVMHLAAQTIVGTANRNPLSTWRSNIEGTWNVLEAVRETQTVSRVLVASSDKAYGAQPVLPYREDTPLQGHHPYDVSKSCADLIAQSYAISFGLPVCITRCANFFGAGDLNFNRLIPGTIRSLLQGEAPVIRSDGSFVRDYLYIEDAAEAYLALAEGMDSKDVKGHAFNFGLGERHTVLDIVRRLQQLMNCTDIKPQILNQAGNEIREQYLCSDKAREYLGWQPRFTLDEGLQKTIDWYREFFADESTCLAS